MPETDLRFRCGYRHRWTNTQGGAYDNDTNKVIVGVNHPLPLDITADFSFTRQWDAYNAIGPLPGVGREDRVDFYSVLLTRPIIPNLQLYVRYDAVNAHSNAGLFTYDQHVIATGIIWDF